MCLFDRVNRVATPLDTLKTTTASRDVHCVDIVKRIGVVWGIQGRTVQYLLLVSLTSSTES